MSKYKPRVIKSVIRSTGAIDDALESELIRNSGVATSVLLWTRGKLTWEELTEVLQPSLPGIKS